MNYLIVNGSPHRGNTWKLVELARRNIETEDSHAVFDEIHLGGLNLSFCCGCSACFRLGYENCPHHEVIGKVVEKIDNADGVIIASTAYNMRETALLKNLFDHLSFMLHRPRFFRSKALVITSTGGIGGMAAAKSISAFLKGIGFNRCYLFSVATYSWNDYRISKTTAERLRKVTRKYYDDLLSRNLHSPSCMLLIPYNLFRGMSIAYAKGTEFQTEDGVYWTEESRRSAVYDSSVHVSLHHKFIGHLFYMVGKMAGRKIVVTYRK